MPIALDDPAQSRVAELEAITVRRNELLGQMYHLMRQRHGIASITDESDDEPDALQTFLDNFDLHKMGEQGFFKNHVERLLNTSDDFPALALDLDVHLNSRLAKNAKKEYGTRSKDIVHQDEKAQYDAYTSGAGKREEADNELDVIGDGTHGTQSEVQSRSPKHSTEGFVKAGTDGDIASGRGDIKEDVEEVADVNEAIDIDAEPSLPDLNRHVSPHKAPPDASLVVNDTMSNSAVHTVPSPQDNNIIQQLMAAGASENEAVALLNRSQPEPFTATKSMGASTAQSSEAVHVVLSQASAAQEEGSSHPPNRPERVFLKATPTDLGISPSLLIKSPITIPAPLEPSISTDKYSVAVAHLPDKPPPTDVPTPQHIHKVEYTLPCLQILPPEFSRKKASKRKKDRSDKKGGDDLPMGLNRWAGTLNANPVYTRLKRSTKCLSTREWSLAIAELRLIRTVERIEKLKSEGRWGFRQTKKQRGVGGLLKTHWDYLMDEMKWMRTDFREERKWKLALAYDLSTSVLEWHALNSWEERVAHGICVEWKPVQEEEQGEDEVEMDPANGLVDPEMTDEPEEGRHTSLLAVDYTSDDDDMEADEVDPKDVIDPLGTNAEIQEALEGASEARELEAEKADGGVAENVEPKREDTDDTAALRGIGDDVVLSMRNSSNETQGSEPEVIGLKSTSKDPILGSKSSSHSLNGDVDENKSNNTKVKINAYAPMREKIVYGSSDRLFIGPEDIDFFALPDKSDKSEQGLFHALGLSTLFPELQPFTMLDVAPAVTEPTKKKSSRSADKDDPNKRVEETNYTKVMPSGKFMTVKPTLLGPLHPSKRWKDGRWLPIEEFAIPAELDSSNRIAEESLCELFEFKVKTSGKGDGPHAKDARQPRNDQYWSPNDDLLLKSLIDRYPGNWNLIAECFNGARLTTPSDRRTSTDCQNRWRAKWGTDLLAKNLLTQDNTQGDEQTIQVSGSNADGVPQTPATESNVASATSVATSSMTTRGVKRLASVSVSNQQAPSIVGAGSEPKKRRRHFLIQETIRRAAKKRQDHAQKMIANQRKQPGMHDTHIQLHKLAKVTPAELSRQKAEREAAQLVEMQKARARQEELNGKNAPRLAGISVPPQAAAALQAAQQAQTQPNQPQPQIHQMTAQQLQQHQLLLHAQAQATQAQANNRAGSGAVAVAATARQGNVNIARISTPNAPPGVGNARMTPQQLLQLQQRSLSQQMAVGTSVVAANGNAINRDPTASPSHGVANSPSPANVPQQVQGGATRQNQNHYFMNATAGYSAEQINGLRMMMMQQQLQQQQQQNQGNL